MNYVTLFLVAAPAGPAAFGDAPGAPGRRSTWAPPVAVPVSLGLDAAGDPATVRSD